MDAGKKYYRKKVTVRGSGRFPFDMLRYDACIPASEAMSYALNHEDDRTIELVMFALEKSKLPNIDRWRSLGWTVTAVEGV